MSFKSVLLIKPSKTSQAAFIVDPIPLGLEYIAAYIQNYVKRIDIVNLVKDSKSNVKQ